MLPSRIRGMAYLHTFMLGSAAILLFWSWLLMHSLLGSNHFDLSRYAIYCGVLAAAFGLDLLISGFRGTDVLRLDLPAALRLSMRQVLTALGAFLLFLVVFKDQQISRLFLFTFVPVLYLLLSLLNALVPRVLAKVLFVSKPREKTLLVGSTEDAEKLRDWCRVKAHYGLDVLGLVTNDEVQGVPAYPVLGRMNELEAVVAQSKVSQLIVLGTTDEMRLNAFAQLSDRLGVRLLVVRDGSQQNSGRNVFNEEGLQFIPLRHEPLECPCNRLIKKVLDLMLSGPVVLFVLPPVCLAVYLIHRFQSPGPLFFRQKRTGINFKTFWILKFRTMHVDHGTESQQAIQGDNRVFPLGRLMRKLSIDELPQFINVWRGQMSVVGPRPHMVEHTALFVKVSSGFHVRTLVKPGITGLAQVRGLRGETNTRHDVQRRVESDVYYLENWSIFLEWSIILRTVAHVFRPPKTAY